MDKKDYVPFYTKPSLGNMGGAMMTREEILERIKLLSNFVSVARKHKIRQEYYIQILQEIEVLKIVIGERKRKNPIDTKGVRTAGEVQCDILTASFGLNPMEGETC